MRLFACALIAGCLVPGHAGAAQTQPFLFVASPSPQPLQGIAARVHVGVQSSSWRAPDARSLVHGLSVGLGFSPRVAFSVETQSEMTATGRGVSVQALGQWRFVRAPASGLEGALSLGLRREARGAEVVLARVAAARHARNLDFGGHVALEHPLAAGRDAVDLGFGTGLSRSWGGGLRTGLELAAEDLEGLWEPDAEGGAQAFLGPSVALCPPARGWAVLAGGGPALLTRSGPDPSGAPRDLTPSAGYVFRIAVRLAGGC